MSDLRDAMTLFGADSYSGTIVASEQCAEKICKGLLIHTGTDFKFNHSVITLSNQIIGLDLIGGESTDSFKKRADWITRQYALMRYPSDAIGLAPCNLATRDDAEYALSCAKYFVSVVKKCAPELTDETCSRCNQTPCVCEKSKSGLMRFS